MRNRAACRTADRAGSLDVGGGYGRPTRAVLHAGVDCEVVLQDFSRPMLDRARDYLQDYSDRCQCVEVDLRDPDWTRIVGANFDAVVSAIAIHNLRDPAVIARIYADIVRILRPGGCHVEIDHLRSGELADRRRLLRLAGFDSTTVTVEAVDNDHALVKGCSP